MAIQLRYIHLTAPSIIPVSVSDQSIPAFFGGIGISKVCYTSTNSVVSVSVQNNSLSQDIFQRKMLFVSACLYLYGNNVWMKL